MNGHRRGVTPRTKSGLQAIRDIYWHENLTNIGKISLQNMKKAQRLHYYWASYDKSIVELKNSRLGMVKAVWHNHDK